MNFKDMLQKISQLSEATEKTKTGTKHTADAGGYGRKFDTDEEGDEKKKDATTAAKRGRGRPAKGSDETGTVKKYDTKGVGDVFGGGKKPKKEVGTASKKHTLKDWFEHMESQMLAEAEQVTMEPAKQNTQVIKQGTKTLGTVSNPQLAAQIKQSIGKGEMSLAGDQLGEEEENYSAKKARAGKDIGKPGKNFAKIAKSAGQKYGSKDAGERVAGAILAKLRGVKEAEIPSNDSDEGAGLGAGRSQFTLEGRAKADNRAEKAGKKVTKDLEYDMKHKGKDDAKAEKAGKKVTKDIEYDEKKKKQVKEAAKPDFLDMDKDGDKKEPMKKAVADKKKKAVKENMSHKLQAARLEGKAHGLKGHSHCGKNYQDMEEARCYHEGYKEGLDECYGQMPVRGLVGEGDPAATVPGMASQALDEISQEKIHSYMDKAVGSKFQASNDIGAHRGAMAGRTGRYIPGDNSDAAKQKAAAGQVTYDKRNRGIDMAINKLAKEEEMDEGMLGKAALALGGAAALATGAGIGKNVYDYHKKDASGYSQADVDKMMGTDSRSSGYDMAQKRKGNYFEEDEFDEGNAFTGALAKTPKGGKFSVGGKTFTDRSNIDEFAFEAWEKELSNLLTEGEDKIEEGMTVSISKGQQGAPDSVSISAQDAEAEHLLAFVKNAGLGVFGDEAEHSNYGAPEGGSSAKNAPGGIEVVGDHDGMMGMLQKLSGIQQSGDAEASDYADEEDCGCDEETNEATCNECGGMMEAGHSCGSKEMVDEVESEDQMEFEVAEANAPDSGEAEERDEEETDATRDAALATAASQNFANTDAPVNEEDDEENFFHNPKVPADKQLKAPPKEINVDEDEEEEIEDEEEELNEWANEAGKKGTDASYEEDIDFMMKVISGGLNKPKSTGQTTIPVIANQVNRTVSHNTTDINESVNDWKKLAGIIK